MLWRSKEKAESPNPDATPEIVSQTNVSSNSWRELLKSIASFRGDLSSLTAPPFILAPASLLEYCHFWYAGKDGIRTPAMIPASQEEDRFLEVVRMFLSIMKGQYTQRNVGGGFEKKPLNPFLGELFVCRVNGDLLRAEQVSHHPPAYAYKITAEPENGAGTGPTVEQEGHVGIKARFSTTVLVEQLGKTVYSISDGEKYTVSLPPLHLEGFIYGAPYIELDKSSEIVSSKSGYKCTLNYTGAGWVSGKSHTLKGEIRDKDGNLLYTLSGQWNELVTLKNEKTGETTEFVKHAANDDVPPISVVSISEQHEMESQRAWQKVADAIRANDNEAVRTEKSAIENAQRQLRKDEEAAGTKWEHRWFKKTNEEPAEWEFDEEAYAKDTFFQGR